MTDIRIVSEWAKPKSKFVYDPGRDEWYRENPDMTPGKKMVMAIVEVDGRRVTRHVEVPR